MDKNWKVWRQDSHFSWHSYKEYSQLRNDLNLTFIIWKFMILNSQPPNVYMK